VESVRHADLVGEIVKWIKARHGANRGLSLVYDSLEAPLGRRPWPVGGFVPDVIAQTFPSSFFLIGEAKSSDDLSTPHTRHQLEAYIRHLAIRDHPQLVVATPLLMVGFAKSLLRQIASKCEATHVQIVFLADGGEGRVIEC
jgi:hypothetical protein